MKKEKNLFLISLVVEVALFVLCGYSLIQCFVYGYDGEEMGSHIMEIIYLFLHLVFVAIIFYLTFRAFKLKATILNNLMYDEDGKISKKAQIISLIIAIIFSIIAIYSTLVVFGIKLPLLSELSLGLTYDLLNAGYLLSLIAIMCFIFPFLYDKNSEQK